MMAQPERPQLGDEDSISFDQPVPEAVNAQMAELDRLLDENQILREELGIKNPWPIDDPQWGTTYPKKIENLRYENAKLQAILIQRSNGMGVVISLPESEPVREKGPGRVAQTMQAMKLELSSIARDVIRRASLDDDDLED